MSDAAANPLDGLFRAELKAFLSDLSKQPVPEIQDMRAGTLGLIATFAPEALSETATGLLMESRARIHDWPSYPREDWFRLPYLDAACCNLFDDPSALDTVVGNLSHQTRMIRIYLFPALGLAIDRLDLFRSGFVDAMRRNFEAGHFGNEAGICLLFASRLSVQERRDVLADWRRAALAEGDRELIDRALVGGQVSNELIFTEYFDIALHLASAALTLDPGSAHPSPAPSLFQVAPEEMMSRVRKHPLCTPSMALES